MKLDRSPERIEQSLGHRKEGRVQEVRGRRLAQECTLAWSCGECIGWNGTLEMQARQENHERREDLCGKKATSKVYNVMCMIIVGCQGFPYIGW